MDGSYEVLHEGRTVGRMTVCTEGLYYVFSGACALPEEMVYRIQVSCNGVSENLGVLIPRDGMFRLEKRIPVKRLGAGMPQFRILPKEGLPDGKFVPIYPEEPFAYMSKLKDAFLAVRNGQAGVVIRE